MRAEIVSFHELAKKVDLTVDVRDAADAPIVGADVLLKASGNQRQGKSDRQGKFAGGALPSSSFQVTVTDPAYLPEEVAVSPPAKGNPFLWDNPVCSVTGSGVVTVRLSRLTASPIFSISDSELERRGPFNPQAIFAWNYREAWAPNAGFDIIRISLTGVFKRETRHLIDRHSLRRLRRRVGYRNSQKSDRHAPGSHPISQTALQRAQVLSGLVPRSAVRKVV